MVEIVVPDGISPAEKMEATEAARIAVLEHIAECVTRPSKATVTLDDDGQWKVELQCKQARIVRMRRITGYLSSLENFGQSKRAEERDRKKHMKLDSSRA